MPQRGRSVGRPVDLRGVLRRAVLSIRYVDRVRPSTRWEVVLYVDERADEAPPSRATSGAAYPDLTTRALNATVTS